MNFEQVLDFLTNPDGGALLVVLWVVSWGLEEFSWWNGLKRKAKQLSIFVMAALLALLAVFLQNNPEIVSAINPYFKPLYYVGGAWLATQAAHRVNKRLNKHQVNE